VVEVAANADRWLIQNATELLYRCCDVEMVSLCNLESLGGGEIISSGNGKLSLYRDHRSSVRTQGL